MTDTLAARRFVTLHARLIDRRRMDGDPALIRSALAAYRNPDGGFGYLEPDLPDPGSQPITALAALDLLHEIGTAPDDPLCGWLLRWGLRPAGWRPSPVPTAASTSSSRTTPTPSRMRRG